MAKRISSATDKHPQFVRGLVTEDTASTFKQGTMNLPQLTEAGFVVEILKIFWEIPTTISGAVNDGVQIAVYENSDNAIPNISEAGVWLVDRQAFPLTTEGAPTIRHQGAKDFTDGGGNGVLTARKQLFIAVLGVSQAALSALAIQIEYRLVKVSAAELLGMMAGS